MAREIKLIDVLYEVLRGIRAHRLTLPEVVAKFKVVHRIHRLTNKVLVCVVQGNMTNKNYIAKRSAAQYYHHDRHASSTATYMEETLDNIGSETGSKSVYHSLFLNNRELLVEKVDLALVKSSCRNIEAKGIKASGILQFLSTICSHNGQNIARNQEVSSYSCRWTL